MLLAKGGGCSCKIEHTLPQRRLVGSEYLYLVYTLGVQHLVVMWAVADMLQGVGVNQLAGHVGLLEAQALKLCTLGLHLALGSVQVAT